MESWGGVMEWHFGGVLWSAMKLNFVFFDAHLLIVYMVYTRQCKLR